MKEGDILFRIDRTTYAAQVQTIEVQLKFAELRLSQMSELQRRDSGRAFEAPPGDEQGSLNGNIVTVWQTSLDDVGLLGAITGQAAGS